MEDAGALGVADSAPYMHDGSAPTLRDAILRHRGDAREVTQKFSCSVPASRPRCYHSWVA